MSLQSLHPDILILGGDLTSPTLLEVLNRTQDTQSMLGRRGAFLQAVSSFQAPMGRYAVLTPRAVALRFHDVFRRLSDGATFRVLSSENHTPPSAGLDLRSVKAERWEVPQ